MAILDVEVKKFSDLPIESQKQIIKENPNKQILLDDWIEVIVEH